jgi:hypothetical protein
MWQKKVSWNIHFRWMALLFGLSLTGWSILKRPAQAQTQRRISALSIMETKEDMPPDFVYFPEPEDTTERGIDRLYFGRRWNMSKSLSHDNQAKELIRIGIGVGDSPEAAIKGLESGLLTQVQWVDGTFSGKRIGDRARRPPGKPTPENAARGARLRVVKGPVLIDVAGSGHPSVPRDWIGIVEGLARTLVARAEAAIKLGAAPQKSLKVADKSISGQEIKDAGTVAPVNDIAKALGAKVAINKTGSRVTLTAKDKKVEFVVGRSEAVINGKKSTLKFPSLQTGKKGQVMCLVEPIATALGAKVSA